MTYPHTDTFKIAGMTCGHCVRAVREALESFNVDVVNVEIGEATVSYDPDQVDRKDLIEAILDEGYTVESHP